MNRKKKTGKWCKGKVGVEHVTEIVRNHNLRTPCGWYVRNYLRKASQIVGVHAWRYSCHHARRCVKCGKYVEYLLLDPEQCPGWKPLEVA
jgi:hypothetical protein